MVLAPLSARFKSLPPPPTIKLGPSGAGSRMAGSLQWPLLWGWESLLLPPQPPRAFSLRGLRLYFPTLEPWVVRSALFPAVCPVYLCENVGPRGATRRSACPVLCHSESSPLSLFVCECRAAGSASGQTACPIVPHSASLGPATATQVLSAPAAHLRPSYQSGWMFLFYLLGVGLPCRLIFCQFWLCEEVQCIYLRLHLGSPLFFLTQILICCLKCNWTTIKKIDKGISFCFLVSFLSSMSLNMFSSYPHFFFPFLVFWPFCISALWFAFICFGFIVSFLINRKLVFYWQFYGDIFRWVVFGWLVFADLTFFSDFIFVLMPYQQSFSSLCRVAFSLLTYVPEIILKNGFFSGSPKNCSFIALDGFITFLFCPGV